MKKYLFIVMSIFLLSVSCAPTSERTADNTELATYNFNMPDSLQALAANREVKFHTCSMEFTDPSAKLSIFVETIPLDSGVAIIKSIRTVLDQGSDNTTFTAKIHNSQEALRNLKQMAHPATVTVTYTRVTWGHELGSKTYEISLSGACDERGKDKGHIQTFSAE